MKLRRSRENEYQLTKKELQRRMDAKTVSPERVRNILNKLPPFAADTIPTEDIESFQIKG